MKGGCRSRLESRLNSGVRGPQARVPCLTHIDGHKADFLIDDAHSGQALIHGGRVLTRAAVKVGAHEDVSVRPGDCLDHPEVVSDAVEGRLERRQRVVCDEADHAFGPVPGHEEEGAVQRVEARPLKLRCVADVVKPCRGDDFGAAAVRDPAREFSCPGSAPGTVLKQSSIVAQDVRSDGAGAGDE